MKNKLRRKPACTRRDGASGRTSAVSGANCIQFAHDVRAPGPVDCTVHSASAAQARIGCVDDYVCRDLSNVANAKANYSAVWEVFLLSHREPACRQSFERHLYSKEECPSLPRRWSSLILMEP